MAKKPTKKSNNDLLATLIIHGLPTMTEKQYGNLIVWLDGKNEEMQKADRKDYAKRFTARLYK